MSEKVPKQGQEALYLVDGQMFLHLQKTAGGVDYTIHDAQTKFHMGGGHISDATVAKAPYQNYLKAARMEVFRATGIKPRQTERINPIIAGDFYKNQILKTSWEMAETKEATARMSVEQLFQAVSNEVNMASPNTPMEHIALIGDLLFGPDSRKGEMPRQKESVLEQLKTPVNAPIKVTPHKKTKENPSL